MSPVALTRLAGPFARLVEAAVELPDEGAPNPENSTWEVERKIYAGDFFTLSAALQHAWSAGGQVFWIPAMRRTLTEGLKANLLELKFDDGARLFHHVEIVQHTRVRRCSYLSKLPRRRSDL